MYIQSILQAPLAHHDGSELYVDDAQPNLGDVVHVTVRISDELHVNSVYVRTVIDGEPKYAQANITQTTQSESLWTASIIIHNTLTTYRFLLITAYGNLWLNGKGLHTADITDAHDFRLSTFHIPNWTRDAIIYQIFPDRFAKSDAHPITDYPQWAIPTEWDAPVAAHTENAVRQMYGGSIWGITEHLEYIKNLGANVIYMTPFFPAQSNHRYDASTFNHVDPSLGGDRALKALTEKAHSLGIRVIGDLTLNHSGVTHEWFLTGKDNQASPEAHFYYFNCDGHGGYATFDGVESMPKFDHRSSELQHRLYDGPDSVVARYIKDFGLDGWRIDVAQSAGIYCDINLNADIAEKTHATMENTASDTLLIAEHQFDASLTLQGSGWQGTMSYAAFTKPIWAWLGCNHPENEWGIPGPAARYGGNNMIHSMVEFMSSIPWQATVASMNLLDSHDTSRFRTIAGPYQELGIALQMTLPGMPMIFSGDEVGIEGHGLEEARQPFPWDSSRWDHSIYDLYQTLITLRHNHSALRNGGLRWYHCTADSIIYERADHNETLLIEISKKQHTSLISSIDATSLTDDVNLKKGMPMPSSGPSFHIWKIDN
ncbi:glycoside hydrolase family 13 protein [Bifidobacterium miconisargentati]|uniref:glycoside hydrolase family 13 protein n=1 Tax=Bifidobacterium miconisargentati TaxID=2834437 RepID=UPI001BDD1E03|nr:glycoside hydrolase family 13 protein [Bifidobacterium miconisargentati]